MKALIILLSFAMAASSASAQVPSDNPEFRSLKIIQTVAPDFPESLYRIYRNGGQARIDIRVNAQGELSESLAVSYTDRRFADLALKAVKQWNFEPARRKGEPVSVCVPLTFNFEAQGVVLTISATELFEGQINSVHGEANTYRPYTLNELDRIPIPIRADAPRYLKEMAESGLQGKVEIEFYIDEEGTVRMPVIVGQPQMELAELAMEAVRGWKFEPPMRKGQPVLARVQQLFRFSPAPLTGG